MNTEQTLHSRSGSSCELCTATENLQLFIVPPAEEASAENSVLICTSCQTQIEHPDQTDPNHWRCLNDSMWSPVPAVQVLAWRMLTRMRGEGWPAELLDMMYLDEEMLAWAKATGEGEEAEVVQKHVDSNGVELKAGDSVVLIKELNVKGATFAAKRGTAVRNISLVYDNPEHIEGRVNGQQIVILTKYVKKT